MRRDSDPASAQAEDGSPGRATDPATHLKDDFPKIWMHSWENREGVRPALDYRGNRERGDPSLLSRHHWAITERADQR